VSICFVCGEFKLLFEQIYIDLGFGWIVASSLCFLLTAKEMQIERVVGHFDHFNVLEACLLEHRYRLFSSPHHSQVGSPIDQTHRHAVHEADRVQKVPHGVIQIFCRIGARCNIDHGKKAAPVQYMVDSLESLQWLSLVMNRVKCGDIVKGTLIIAASRESRRVQVNKLDVVQPLSCGFPACRQDDFFREVKAIIKTSIIFLEKRSRRDSALSAIHDLLVFAGTGNLLTISLNSGHLHQGSIYAL